MIIGIGIDIVETARIARIYARFGGRFLAHFLHPAEIGRMPPKADAYLASRFAAKEAAVKALGTGFADGITPNQIETDSMPSGAPILLLHGAALVRARELGATVFHLSLSHERRAAVAMVVLEGCHGQFY